MSKKTASKYPVTKEELIELAKIKPLIVTRDLFVTWAITVMTIAFMLWQPHVVVILLGMIIIGSMQNTLILWTHEASHYHITRNRALNDFLGDLLMAGPVGFSVLQYRWEHTPHHLHLGDPEHDSNPVLWICVRGGHLFSELFLHFTGIKALQLIFRRFLGTGYPNNAIKATGKEYPKRSITATISFLSVNLIIVVISLLAGKWYLFPFLWLVPFFTVALLFNNLRSVVEHQPSSDVCDTGMVKIPAKTRVLVSNWLERNLIAGVGFYFHYEHHVAPGVPYHRLKELRQILTERGHFNDPQSDAMLSNTGYIGTLWQLAMTPGYGVRLLNPFFEPEEHSHAHPTGMD